MIRSIRRRDRLDVRNLSCNSVLEFLHPGASQANRRWEGFGELLKKLHAGYEDAAFLLFEGPEEQEAVERVREAAEECGANYIVSRTAIAEYMHRMAACDAVICNDSGAGHIAAAYSVSVYVVFGPFLPETSRPHEKENVFVFPAINWRASRVKYGMHTE